ncbi:hypothetical protein [Microbacterium abyssi]|uniref:hypothetical protein n=1 Tax=Microbacterium abyssi TaxID=2782166 RepID=UPI001E396303|nr:hypothetical protein [Microbacterium sp. A18JL241]
MSQQQVSSGERLGILKSVILGASALFYAYGVWNAVAHLVTVAQFGMNPYGWFVMIFSALFPIIVFIAAFAIGRRRSASEFGIVMLAGLALVAVFWMNVVALSTLNFSSLTT